MFEGYRRGILLGYQSPLKAWPVNIKETKATPIAVH
jgi:hypothetical protein